jgi:hypothetical protein
MENEITYCKNTRKFFTPVKIVGIIKCPYCGEHLYEHIGNLNHTTNKK